MQIDQFSLELFSLNGKNAIITGGNSGLGQAFSLALAKAGANIIAASHIDDAGTTEALVRQQNVDYQWVKTDLTQSQQATELISLAIQQFGQIDILINCAGISLTNEVHKFERNQWDRMIAINLSAAFDMSQAVVEPMMAQGSGKIINICSLFSFLGGLGSPAYAASKHGIAGLTKAYCDELAQYNIQVNGIAPGYFDTALTRQTLSDQDKQQKIVEHIPAGRLGHRYDLMGAAVFLASNASNYVNGHILTIDGGYLVR